jgi:hypothetical protein
MFVKYLFCDDVTRKPPSQDPEAGVVRSPAWGDVESAIRTLDGERVRMIIISESEPTAESYYPFGGRGMMIGGGESGRYICRVGGDDGDTIYCLSYTDNKHLGWQMVMFGQPTHFEGQECVDLETVIRVAYEFAKSGQFLEGVKWQKSTG